VKERKWRGELLRAFGIVGCLLGVAELRPPQKKLRVSILLPKTSQIILDNVVVLDKETASFDAPLGEPGKSLSAIHTQP
jgi:hypothetical protein